MTEKIAALVTYRLEQSRDALRSAEKLLQEHLWRDSLNRSYYAMFYGVLALLAVREMGTSKHSGAIALFDKEFVKSGVFSKELSAILHSNFDMRLEADYEEMSELDEQDAHLAIEHARKFVTEVRSYLDTALNAGIQD